MMRASHLPDDELLAALRADTPLNQARRVVSSTAATIEQKSAQSRPPSPVDIRRMEFEAAETIMNLALAGAAIAWQPIDTLPKGAGDGRLGVVLFAGRDAYGANDPGGARWRVRQVHYAPDEPAWDNPVHPGWSDLGTHYPVLLWAEVPCPSKAFAGLPEHRRDALVALHRRQTPRPSPLAED